MKWIDVIPLLLLLLTPGAKAGGNLCKPVEVGKTEPKELIISEDDFTHEKALYALSILGHITEKPPMEHQGSELYIETGNAEIEIRGYILKSQCMISHNQKACSEFCDYINKRRYWFD